MKQLTLTEVEWIDAWSSGAGLPIGQWRKKVRKAKELHHVVGYLIYEDEHQIAVAQNVSPGQVSDVFVIPKGVVTQISYPSTTVVVETKCP